MLSRVAKVFRGKAFVQDVIYSNALSRMDFRNTKSDDIANVKKMRDASKKIIEICNEFLEAIE